VDVVAPISSLAAPTIIVLPSALVATDLPKESLASTAREPVRIPT
jgi:hypothetical protein